MRILHLVHCYYPSVGGSQDMFRNFSEGLVKLYGDDVTVFTTNGMRSPHIRQENFIYPSEEVINGVKIRRFPFYQRWTPATRLLARIARRYGLPFAEYLGLLRNGPIAPRMLHALAKIDVDVICGTSYPYLHMFYPALVRHFGKRIPFVYYGSLHAQDSSVPRYVLHGIKTAQAYAASTLYEREILISAGIPADKISIVGPGVHLDRFIGVDHKSIRNKYGWDDAPVVGFIGRQVAHKGIDTLLLAMSSVWKYMPSAQLLIAGTRTDYSDYLLSLLTNLSPRNRSHVTIIDSFEEEDKASYYAACDLFVSVSSEESFGIVYLEAWATGKAVIGSDIGAVRSVVNNGENGILVPNGDPEKLSRAILMLLTDESLRVRLAECGFNKVRSEHSWEAATSRLRSVYVSVI